MALCRKEKNLLLLPVIEPRFLRRLENFVPDTVNIEGAYRPHYAETDALEYLYTSRHHSIHRIKFLILKF